jgi:hypothetical protein
MDAVALAFRTTRTVTANREMATSRLMKRLVYILISFLVQQVIMFSETRVGFYAHTVSNGPYDLVAKSVTKSDTFPKFEAMLLF